MDIYVYIYLLLLIFICGFTLYISQEENSEIVYSILKCIWLLFYSSEGPSKKIITKTLSLMLLTFTLVFITVFTA